MQPAKRPETGGFAGDFVDTSLIEAAATGTTAMPMLLTCLASLLVLAGPPALPPVPGEAIATEPVAAAPADPGPAAATPEPVAAAPSAAAPSAAVVTTQTPTSPGPAASPTAAVPAPTSPVPTSPVPTSPVMVQPPQPTDVAGPPPSAPVASLAPGPIYAADLHAPPPPTSIDAPHYRGRGMLIGAGLTGAAGLGIRLWASYLALTWKDPLTSLTLGVLHNPFIGASIGLLGGGMAMRGRHDAHGYLFEGRAARKRRTVLGWSLFGAGTATWLITRVYGAMGCRDAECTIAVWESGYYLSLAATVPGIVMGGYGSGFDGYTERFGHLAPKISVAPMASRDTWGLSLSGRF